MKLHFHRSLVPTGFLTVLAALAVSAAAYGQQADLTFSGGNNAPLELTINAPITYLVGTTALGPVFLFQGVGDPFGENTSSVTGSITYTINGGAPITINEENSGYVGGETTANDLGIYSFPAVFAGVTAGDTVMIGTGTIITSDNIAGAPPASGTYNTILVDGGGNQISVPEPSTWAMMLGGLGLLGGVRCLRRA